MNRLIKEKAPMKILLMLVLLGSSLSGERPGEKPIQSRTDIDNVGVFDVNRIRCEMENNGMIVTYKSGHSGLKWPKDVQKGWPYAVFSSEVWFGGKVNGEIRLVAGDGRPELVPGPWGSDPKAPENKFYKVNRTDLANPLENDDFQNWPVELGAPWVDVDEDGVYTPLPYGPDHPDFIGDQVIWYVANDSGPGSHGIWHTKPLGLEVQHTIFGFNRPDALGDMMFVKVLAINKGGNTINSAYIGIWSDPDLGDAIDDFVGCDTTLNMGICYNDGLDADYEAAIGSTPAVGYDLLQGPMVPSLGDTAYFFGRLVPDFRNLEMTAFFNYMKSTRLYSFPGAVSDVYNNLKGLLRDGSALPYEASGGSRFMTPGDPLLNVNANDSEFVDSDLYGSYMRLFLMSSGPFTMAPGDSQEVVFAIILATDKGGPLESYRKLKVVDQIAQRFYDSGMKSPEMEVVPEIRATAYPEAIVLNWDDQADRYNRADPFHLLPIPVSYDSVFTTSIRDSIIITQDTVISDLGDTTVTTHQDTAFYYIQVLDHVDTLFKNQPTRYRFEGYNIYQLETPLGMGGKIRIAKFDLINDVTKVVDKVFSPDLGLYVERIQPGNDTGIQHYLRVEQDALNNNEPLKINREYYFGVIAYAYNPYGAPKVMESAMSVVSIRPQIPNRWVKNDTSLYYEDDFSAEHVSGISNGSVGIHIVNPLVLSGDDYEITFSDWYAEGEDTLNLKNWQLTNLTTNQVLIDRSFIFNGIDLQTGFKLGDLGSPVLDGFQIEITDPPVDLNWVGVVANADGELSPPVDALASWYFPDYLVSGGIYTNQQVTTDAIWFFDVGPLNWGSVYTYNQIDSMTNYSGGLGSINQGIGALLPDDFEVRFTGNGKAINYWGDGSVVNVPFEWWNIKDLDDPYDDYQLIPYLRDEDDNGEWNLQYGRKEADHPASAARNDPWTDRVYVLSPTDETPGTQGYDNFIAGAAVGKVLPDWRSKPGDNDPGGPMDAWNVFSHTVFMIWNGGDVTAATSPADYKAESPERGTVFRITTNKILTPADRFTFSTGDYTLALQDYRVDSVKVWPNPYFGYNPEERTPTDQQMHFIRLPETGKCTIRIFDLAGNVVRILHHDNAGKQDLVWDLRNTVGKPVASGMYLAHIQTDQGTTLLKLAVIQPDK
jgi:hypothetical protein